MDHCHTGAGGFFVKCYNSRRAYATAISLPKIYEVNTFYYLETGFINFYRNLIGGQIDVRSTCPP